MAFTSTFFILVGGGTWLGQWIGKYLSSHANLPNWLSCRLAGVGGVLGFFTGLGSLGAIVVWMSNN